MIVHDFDAVRAAFGPDEAHAPAIVDANAELSGPIAFQGLKPIAGRRAQGVQRGRGVQHVELSRDHFRNGAPLRRACAIPEKPFGLAIRRANDHEGILYTIRIALCLAVRLCPRASHTLPVNVEADTLTVALRGVTRPARLRLKSPELRGLRRLRLKMDAREKANTKRVRPAPPAPALGRACRL